MTTGRLELVFMADTPEGGTALHWEHPLFAHRAACHDELPLRLDGLVPEHVVSARRCGQPACRKRWTAHLAAGQPQQPDLWGGPAGLLAPGRVQVRAATRDVDGAPELARERFAAARFARLASVRPSGAPHLVPLVFALVVVDGVDTIVSSLDHEPQRSAALQRLADVASEPRVSLLVDHAEEDWEQLWWVRADGTARVLDPSDPVAAAGLDALLARYPQYTDRRPSGPVLAVAVDRWTGWTASA